MTALFNKRKDNKQEEAPQEKVRKPVELRTLLEWEALVRPFKKRDREYYTTIAAIVFLVAVILLFLKEWLLIAVLVALMFVTYVLATVEPEKTTHVITTRGIITGGKAYKWEHFKRFWFEEKWKEKILQVDTVFSFPSRLMMLLGDQDEKKVKGLLESRIQFEEPEETLMDKSAKWLQEKVPLESK